MDEHVVIFRTGQLFEIDMASNHLKEAGIPHFTQEELASGIRFAMPAAPATGPGVWWNILVPGSWEERAREKLRELPFTEKEDPSVWDFQPTPKVKAGWRVYVALFVLLPFAAQLGLYGWHYLTPRPPTEDSVRELFEHRYPNVKIHEVSRNEHERSIRGFRITYFPLGRQEASGVRRSEVDNTKSFESTEPAGAKSVYVLFKKSKDGSWTPTPELPPVLN